MMQNSLYVAWHRASRLGALAGLGALAACSGGKDIVTPPVTPTATAVSLNVYGAKTVTGGGGVTFVTPGRYAVIPQYAAAIDFATGTNRSTVADYPFAIGGLGTVTARIDQVTAPPMSLSVTDAFHLRLRNIEREEAPRSIAYMQALRAHPPVNLRVGTANAAPAATMNFNVLSALTTSTYTSVSARLLYVGNNILLYVDNQSPTTNGFSDAQYQAFGHQMDVDLFPLDVATWGGTSDLDGNQRTYVLFTPIVNRLTLNSGSCGTYVAGFFNGADLSPGNTNGNKAEIFYSSVPGEPAGGSSCALLSQATVQSAAPATFIHELQHMISYNQHVLLRSGSTESIWLNEGLSHMSEELGGKIYESRYPCPNLPPCPGPGRASPAQIFPDSAQGFLPPNFGNAYDFFSSRQDFSLTSPTGFGTIEERGVAWLFLRWLADQKGEAKLSQLVQTQATGAANIEAVMGESFPVLFADYMTAVLLDDFPGATAGQISTRYQFTSRNLRAIYARLNSIAASAYPTAYPLNVNDLPTLSKLTPASASQTILMKPGSLDLFQFTSTTANAGMAFKPSTGTNFQANLNAQVTVVRLP